MAISTLSADQSKLVQQMAPLVKRIAYHFMARLPASVHVDDLIQAGLMGLLDAAKNFDDTQGAQFETYAIQRIRGSILDELRQADWLPRNVRKNLRRIEATINMLEQRLGRAPKEQELADELGVGLDEYQHMLLESRGYQLLHYEDFQESEDSDFFDVFVAQNQVGPLDVLEDQRFRRALVQAIGVLPEREKIVMGLYYEQEMNLKEMARFSACPNRACASCTVRRSHACAPGCAATPRSNTLLRLNGQNPPAGCPAASPAGLVKFDLAPPLSGWPGDHRPPTHAPDSLTTRVPWIVRA